MTVVGIDLGTSKTVAAIGTGVVPLPAQGGNLLPSVVAFPPNRAMLVGHDARRRRPIDPKNTILSAKRLIGRRWGSPDVDEFMRLYPFEIVRSEDDGAAFKTRMGQFTPTQIGTFVLGTLLRQSSIDGTAVSAAIAVPVVFTAREREATLTAARSAGLASAELIDEPLATLLAHLHGGRHRPRYAAVYDFGGGTLDVAVVDCSVDPVRILGFGGDLYLGGDDLDKAIAGWAADQVLQMHRWDLRVEPSVFARLEAECERAKIRLSSAAVTEIELSQVDPAAEAAASVVPITREVLSRLSYELVRRSFLICDQVLHQAGLKVRDIDALFYAGGTMLLPMIREPVEGYFGRKAVCDFDPTEVVAIGASLAHAR